jgi:hypothetical protein
VELEIGGRDRDRTCDLIHAMDALSQLSYTPVTQQDELQMVWQTGVILTNPPMKFHCDELMAICKFREDAWQVSPLPGLPFRD